MIYHCFSSHSLTLLIFIVAQSIIFPGQSANFTGTPPVRESTKINITILPTITTTTNNNSSTNSITDTTPVNTSLNVTTTTISPTQANSITFSMTATLEEVGFINLTNTKILKIHDILAEKIGNYHNTTQIGLNSTFTHSSVLTSIIPITSIRTLTENNVTVTSMASNINVTNFTTHFPVSTMNLMNLEENTSNLTLTQNTNLPDNYYGFLEAASDMNTINSTPFNTSHLSYNSNIYEILHSITRGEQVMTTSNPDYSVLTSIIPLSADAQNSSQQRGGIKELLGNEAQIQIYSTQRPDSNLIALQGPDQVKEQLSASGHHTMKDLQSETSISDDLASLINNYNLNSNNTLANIPDEIFIGYHTNTSTTSPVGGEFQNESTTIAITPPAYNMTNNFSVLPESSMISPLEPVTQIGTYIIGRNETIPTALFTQNSMTVTGPESITIQNPIAEPIIDSNQSISINNLSAPMILNETLFFELPENGSTSTNTVLRVQSESIMNEILNLPLPIDTVASTNTSSTMPNHMTTQEFTSYPESKFQAAIQSTLGSEAISQNLTLTTMTANTQPNATNSTENMITTEAIASSTFLPNLTGDSNLTSDAFQDIQERDDVFTSAPESDLAAHVMQFLGSIEPKNKTPQPSIQPYTFQNPVHQSVTFNGLETSGGENDLVALMIASLNANGTNSNVSMTLKMNRDISMDTNTTLVVPLELPSPATTLDSLQSTNLGNGSINNQTFGQINESSQTTAKQDLLSTMEQVLSQGTPQTATTYALFQPVRTIPSIETDSFMNTTYSSGNNGTDLVAMMKHFAITDSMAQNTFSNPPQSESKSVGGEETSKMAKFMPDSDDRDILDDPEFLTSHFMLQEGQLTSTPQGLAQDLGFDDFVKSEIVFGNITNHMSQLGTNTDLQAEITTSLPMDLLRVMEESLTTVQQVITLPHGLSVESQTDFNNSFIVPMASLPIDRSALLSTQLMEQELKSTNRSIDLLAAIRESLNPPTMTTALQTTTTLIPFNLHEHTFLTETVISNRPTTHSSTIEYSEGSSVLKRATSMELERAADNETQVISMTSPPPSEVSLFTSVILNAGLGSLDTLSTQNSRGHFSGQVQELTIIPGNAESTVGNMGSDGEFTTHGDAMMANMEVASPLQPFIPPAFPILGTNETFTGADQETDEGAKGKYFEDIGEQSGGEVMLEEMTRQETVVPSRITTMSTTASSVATKSVMPLQSSDKEDEGFVLRFNDNCHLQELNSQDKMAALLSIKERIQSALGLSSQAPVSLLECEPFMKVKVTPIPLAPLDKSTDQVMSRAENLIRQRSLSIPTPWRLGSNGEGTMMADAIFPANQNLPLETRGGGERAKGTHTHTMSSSAVIVIVLVVVVSFLIAIMVAVTFYHCVRRKRGSKDLLAHQLTHGGSSFALAAGANGGGGHGNYRLSGPGVYGGSEGGGGFIPPPYARSEMIDMKKLGNPGLGMPANGGGGNGIMAYYDAGVGNAPATAPYYVKNANNNNSNDGRASLASIRNFGSRMPLGAFSPGYVKKAVATVTPTNAKDDPKPSSEAEQLAAGLEAISGSSESTSGHGGSTAPSSQSGSYHGRKPPASINHKATDILLGQDYNSILLDHNNNIPEVESLKNDCPNDDELRRDSGVIQEDVKTPRDKSPQVSRSQNGPVEVA